MCRLTKNVLVNIKNVNKFFVLQLLGMWNHIESLQETCITSLRSFKPMETKLCSGQEILYKINQRGIIKKKTR